MLDDFRAQADDGSLFEDDDPLEFDDLGDFQQEYDDFEEEPVELDEEEAPNRPFLGMTAPQRFVLAVILLVDVCIFGFAFLLVTGRVVI